MEFQDEENLNTSTPSATSRDTNYAHLTRAKLTLPSKAEKSFFSPGRNESNATPAEDDVEENVKCESPMLHTPSMHEHNSTLLRFLFSFSFLMGFFSSYLQ